MHKNYVSKKLVGLGQACSSNLRQRDASATGIERTLSSRVPIDVTRSGQTNTKSVFTHGQLAVRENVPVNESLHVLSSSLMNWIN